VAGPLYRADDGALYLTAYAPLPGRPGWVVAVEGSATLGAVDALARRQAWASGAVLAGVAVLGAALAAAVTRPLRRLANELGAVVPGDPPERVVAAGPREVGQVASAARRLLVAIRERDGRVDAAHREKVGQLTRVAAEIAHEVRNPLNAMSLSIDRLARLEDPARRAELGARLRAQVDELERIVARLVDLTRPLEVVVGPVELDGLLRGLSDAAEVDLVVRGDAGVVVSSDPTLLREIVRNLLLNAAQAGARTVRVEVRAGPPVTVEVEDDGAGVSDPDHLFDWFHTTRARGSGLGLPTSRRKAEALGGSLELASARPARFVVALPAPREGA
jgi:signal transduction histidine kinase